MCVCVLFRASPRLTHTTPPSLPIQMISLAVNRRMNLRNELKRISRVHLRASAHLITAETEHSPALSLCLAARCTDGPYLLEYWYFHFQIAAANCNHHHSSLDHKVRDSSFLFLSVRKENEEDVEKNRPFAQQQITHVTLGEVGWGGGGYLQGRSQKAML